MATGKIWSTLDLTSGYHQVRLADEDREKTAVMVLQTDSPPATDRDRTPSTGIQDKPQPELPDQEIMRAHPNIAPLIYRIIDI
jgi:hypothetical protein